MLVVAEVLLNGGFKHHVPEGAVSLCLDYYTRGDLTVSKFGDCYDLSKRTYVSTATGKKACSFNYDGHLGS